MTRGGIDRGSTGWRVLFRVQYRFLRLVDPLIRRWRRLLPGFSRIVDVRVTGRRSGRTRRVLVTLLTVEDATYLGHPNGDTNWTVNLAAAGRARIVFPDGTGQDVSAVRLFGGPELDAVIRATWSQQPFPGNVIYWLARHHVRRVGVYHRLVGVSDAADRPPVEAPCPRDSSPA